VPDKKRLRFCGYGGPLIRDPATGAWNFGKVRRRAYAPVALYDPDTRQVVIVKHDVTAQKWTDPKPKDDIPAGGPMIIYYDAARNVTVYYNSRNIWVYRCRRAKK